MIQPGSPLTLGAMFEDNARRFGDDLALEFGAERRSHSELYRNGCRLAAALEGLGMRKQDRMAVLSMNNIAFVETYVAAWTAGYVVGTVNFRLALPEIIWILNDIGPKVLLVEAQYAPLIPALREAVPTITAVVVLDGEAEGAFTYADLLASGSPDGPSTRATEGDVASLIYTSGTTGRPKGCILGQRESAFNMLILPPSMGNLPGDRFLCIMPLFHIGAMAIALAMLSNGGVVVIHRQFDPPAVIRALVEDRITHALLAPTMVQMVLQQPEVGARPCPDLRMIMYSAAPMPSTVLRQGMKLFGPIFLQMMGSSEGCSMAWLPMSMHRPDGTPREQKRLMSIGTPYRGVAIRIVDDNGRDCPAGEPGEVILKSPVMFRGYWNNTAATLDAIRDGWYYSGDVGQFDEDGYVYLVDRKKDMIISGGENIYSREVEEALLQHPAVSEAAVIGNPDETWGEIVCAIVVPVAGASVTEKALIEHSQTLIAGYKKPRRVVFADDLPRMVSGKIDKKALRALYGIAGG
ncbi:long-chain-fatty-acid--CoA ligase [Rhizobium sp. CRIBSB]|nr:long-chain-fatty-acid--CoA ligase [Rhizobium sp. CRIBSB]